MMLSEKSERKEEEKRCCQCGGSEAQCVFEVLTSHPSRTRHQLFRWWNLECGVNSLSIFGSTIYGTWNVEWSLSFRHLLEASSAKIFSVKSEE